MLDAIHRFDSTTHFITSNKNVVLMYFTKLTKMSKLHENTKKYIKKI